MKKLFLLVPRVTAALLLLAPAAGPTLVLAASPEVAAAKPPPPNAASVQARLDGLRAAMQKARDGITQSLAGTSDPVFDLALADIDQAIGDIARATTYLHEHPEENLLPSGLKPIAVPGLRTLSRVRLAAGRLAKYPGLADAFIAAPNGLNRFLSDAAPVNLTDWIMGVDHKGGGVIQPGPGPVVGLIGGFRDKIIHDVGFAASHFAEASGRFMAANGPATQAKAAPKSPTTNSSGYSGAISGMVVDINGDPAVNVLISVGLTDAHDDSAATINYRVVNDAIPATISDENGAFTIRDLPPGRYIVTGSLGGVRGRWFLLGPPYGALDAMDALVEVKPGEVAKMAVPLNLQ